MESEAFGAEIGFSGDGKPYIEKKIIITPGQAEAIKIPNTGAGRTAAYIKAVTEAGRVIKDRPVFASVTGPFAIASNLTGGAEFALICREHPKTAHNLLKKCSDFLYKYIMEYKNAGADGVIIAEPAACILPANHYENFSSCYVRDIIDKVQDESFIVIYHSGGNAAPVINPIISTGASGYIFGSQVNMPYILDLVPDDKLVFGNIDPALFLDGTPGAIRDKTLTVMSECCCHDNFIISSGGDIPSLSPWENIDAFFAAVNEFYESRAMTA